MVRLLLGQRSRSAWSTGRIVAGLAILLVTSLAISLATLPAQARTVKSRKEKLQPAAPDLLMDGGRKLSFERSFSLEREVNPKRSFWTRVVDVIAGQPDFHYLVGPYSVVTDSHGRILVTDLAAGGVHIFDFEQQKYKFLSRRDEGKIPCSRRSAWRWMRRTIFM